MTERPPRTPRWGRRALLVTAGTLGVAASGVTLASIGRQAAVPSSVRLAAATTGGAAGADQAAVDHVDRHYSGPLAARVLGTEPDLDRGVPVYDGRRGQLTGPPLGTRSTALPDAMTNADQHTRRSSCPV